MCDMRIKYEYEGQLLYAYFTSWDEYMKWCGEFGRQIHIKRVYGVIQ